MTVHLILQGKGGVGKTFTANMLTQYLRETGKKLICIDTDPVNASFAAYKNLKVKHLNLIVDDAIKPRVFDDLIEDIVENKSSDFVIDTGASSFIPMTKYLIDNEVVPTLKSMKIDFKLHTVVTGGESFDDTINGINTLLQGFDSDIYVWLNEYFGKVKNKEGKEFDQMDIFINNTKKIKGLILISQKGELFNEDIKEMLESKLTFDEAEKSKKFRLMTKSRLFRIKTEIFDQLESLLTQSLEPSNETK